MINNLIQEISQSIKAHQEIETSFGRIDVKIPHVGQGGNGLVYEVEFDGPAIVKLLCERIEGNPSRKYLRFQREYLRLAKLPSHRNLVRMFHYELVVIGDLRIPAIFMERCEQSLKSFVQSFGRLQEDDLHRLCVSMCSAIGHLHKYGVVHRDIKPENILVRSDGTFALADFGIAKFDSNLFPGKGLTRKGDRMANFQFSAPEQFEDGVAITSSADIFSLGQVLYWCVTGQTFRGSSPPKMEAFDSSLAKYDSLVQEMSLHDPVARIQTAEGVTAHLNDEEEAKRQRDFQHHVRDSIVAFERVLRRCSPGERGIVHFTDNRNIERLMSFLSELCGVNNLWWTKGYKNEEVKHVSKIKDEMWLVDWTECRINECWLVKDAGCDRCAVLIRSEPLPSFGFYEHGDGEDEIAGFVDGNYFDYRQEEDGFARVGDEIVELEGRSTQRRRFLQRTHFLLATKFNSVLVPASDPVVHSLISDFDSGSEITIESLQPLFRLPQDRTASIFN